MRRSSSKATGRKTPESRNQPGSSLENANSTGLMANHTAGQGRWGCTGDEGCSLRSCFLLGLWPLLSPSQWNFLWTLLYLNSPMDSERTAGRLLCNSAAQCRGIQRWFSHIIPERSIYLAGLEMIPAGLDFFVFSLSGVKSTWLQANLIILYICIHIFPKVEFFLHF